LVSAILERRLQSFVKDNKVKVTRIGHWVQFSEDDPNEIYATCDYSNIGYVENAKILRSDGSLDSQVICHDTINAGTKCNRCIVMVYSDNGQIKYIENRISYEPDIYTYYKHGSQITFDSVGHEIEHNEFKNGRLKKKINIG
jgi:hypothetical protein